MSTTRQEIFDATHTLPSDLLGKRIVGWMDDEANGQPWFICALTMEGHYRLRSDDDMDCPDIERINLAKVICYHLNKTANHGGAWLTGWIGEEFYMLWKDKDGDIQIPIESKKYDTIKEWAMSDFVEQANQAHLIWENWHKDMNYRKGQQVMLAKGERLKGFH